ncbi:MAG: glycoside hydrolase family 3 C-terminal domain-containing protein [Acidobacteriaceae bacterium]|nr:glycoside hydrolase family 3 C-terminal domain-containing protein [Acidobacteriaceae bacterium]
MIGKQGMCVLRIERLVFLLLFVVVAPAVHSQEPLEPQDIRYQDFSLNQRVTDIVGRMTLEEKIRMLFGGTTPGLSILPGIPRLGIPPIYPSDGPRGVTLASTATAFPAGIGLAASWDPELLKAVGAVIGEEARASGKTMIYGPAVNIDRDPLDGRFFEYFTEDPYLNAQLAVGFVKGVQSQRVAAAVKHFCCNNREWNRNWYMSNVSERALRELYLPGFEAAIKEGGAWGVMTAANGINGHYAAAQKDLITGVLRNEWSFKGIVLTDYNQARGTLESAQAGLDVGMPWGDWETTPFGKPLMDAVEHGQIPESIIDDKVRHIVSVLGKVGLLDGRPPTEGGSINIPRHQAVALRAAEESLVLLKNNNHVLPLDVQRLKKIVVLGPNANVHLCQGGYGGSSGVSSPYEVTILEGLRKRLAGSADVEYINLEDATEFQQIAPEYWKSIDGVRGLKAEYFNDDETTPALSRIEPQVNFTWQMSSPDPIKVHTDNFRAHLSGTLVPAESGYYTFRLTDEDTGILTIHGNPVIRNMMTGQAQSGTAIMYLVAGQSYDIEIDYHALKGDASLRLEWSRPWSETESQNALQALKPKLAAADAVIFVGGWGFGMDTEGADRQNMDFPKGQQELINSIAPLNPHTVVVLVHGAPFTVQGWIHSVPAVLDAFYPGMEGGTAVAEALVGDISPSGRLSFSWPRKLSDSPSHAIGTEDKDNVNYREGVFVGYRYYETYHVTPEFSFGYGLSYASFSFSSLQVSQRGSDVDVAFTVANDSERNGTEIAQLYLAPPRGEIRRPVRELKGFARVSLDPHEKKTVHFTLHRDDFAYWDEASHGWKVPLGTYKIEAGESASNIPLTSSLSIVALPQTGPEKGVVKGEM